MNFLRRTLSINMVQRCYCSILSSPANRENLKSLQAEKLSERSLIRIAGTEVNQFLQGLVTNDIEHLQRSSSAIYALFLNKGGRILYDSIIYRPRHENTLLIECDDRISENLIRHLKLFRVRRKIAVESLVTDYSVWVVHGGLKSTNVKETTSPTTTEPALSKDVILTQDPRLKNLGTRVLAPFEYNIQDISKLFPENELVDAEDENDYMTLRLKLGISEGIVDHPPGKALPLESNGDYLHGISFQKGCYLGQELTARTHHTGVIRKRLMPVEISGEIIEEEGNMNVKTSVGESVGVLRGYKSKCGIALIRIEKVEGNPALKVCGAECSVRKPFWWPAVMPKTSQIGTIEAGIKT